MAIVHWKIHERMCAVEVAARNLMMPLPGHGQQQLEETLVDALRKLDEARRVYLEDQRDG